MLSPGAMLGPFRILAPLGAGGMGEVYRAHDTRLGRDVAVKVIRAGFARDSDRIRRFEQEARAAGALSHPNVCVLHDIGVHEGAPYVVMELLEGESLRESLKAGPLPVRKAIDLIAQAASGLAAAHEKGIVHRDLKPENLFVTRDGRAKVLDFGLAKLTRPEASGAAGDNTIAVPDAESGVLLGTAGYMAPEQVKGEPSDHRADLFALGAILYELVAGRRAFRGATRVETLHAIVNDEPPPVTSLRPDCPPELARILRICLAKDPERRIQTAKDVRNQLEDLLSELQAGGSRRVSEAASHQPVEESFLLTAAHVRQLSARDPRLVGRPMIALHNRVESDTLLVLLHGVGGDHRRFEAVVRNAPYRAVAPTLVGFEPVTPYRPVLGLEDHSQLLRILLRDLAQRYRPKTTILVGFSAGADQFLRMAESEEGLGIEASGLLALGANVSLETCFVSKLYARLDPKNPEGLLDVLAGLEPARSLSIWPVVHMYHSQTFSKLGADLELLVRYSADVIAPFTEPGEPLAAWFRAAKAKIPCVRFVFSLGEAGPAEALLARHLEENVLGDEFTEGSFVMEPIHHVELTEPALVLRHLDEMVEEVEGRGPRES